MTEITSPVLLDGTGQEIVSALKSVAAAVSNTEATQQAMTAIQAKGEAAIQAVEQAKDAALENIGAGIDNTLSMSGQAADAKAVGDELESLKDQIADLAYEPIEITAFTNNVGTVEMGSTVTAVTLSWTTSKTPSSLTLDGASIDTALTSQALTGQSIAANKTYTLSATDEREATASKTTSITFLNGVYWGVGAAAPTLDSTFILGLTKGLQSSRTKTFTVNAGANQHIYYACPSRYGTASFNVGGFDGGFSKIGTIEFTNASGYAESYDIYKSDNANLGSTTVKVS